jgi:DNA-binding CsgD family transcriptional regulator
MAGDNTTVLPRRRGDRRHSGETPVLEAVAGSSRGQVFALERAQSVIGKGAVDIRLFDSGVSRHHAKIVRSAEGSLSILDLASTNGTFVNDAQVDLAVLREGDRIQIGPDAVLQLAFRPASVEQRATPEPAASSAAELSQRQLEVARKVAAGMTNAAIAEALCISPRTVASHLDHIYSRLDLRSRAALTRWLADAGLL